MVITDRKQRTVILGAKRTPIGKFGGRLQSVSAVKLGGVAIDSALRQSELPGSEVDEVIMGMVLQGGCGQIPSRQAAHIAGLDWDVPTETINKVCASGIRSVTLADQIIRAGDARVIVAGGMENMSQAPYFLPHVRWGQRLNDGKMIDMMVHDGLQCPYDQVHMANHANRCAAEHGVSRDRQDEWALRSHKRAVAARVAMQDEIEPVHVIDKRLEASTVDQDESPREDTSLKRLHELKPVFEDSGSVTAGNAPGLNDGAAALVLASSERAKQLNIEPLAEIIGHAVVGVEARKFPTTPGLAVKKLLQQTGRSMSDIKLFEINEAFASVALIAASLCDINENIINVNGGAVAYGHPIGASGSRILMTLIYELRRRGGGLGVASICSGSGQGDAILVNV